MSSPLQRGRARESAERLGADQKALLENWLQRGRARESAERRRFAGQLLDRIPASTGPRSGERGETVHRPGSDFPGAASTGPRSGERGESPPVASTLMDPYLLQRGRARESAERCRCRSRSGGSRWLQRGRARESAERSRRDGGHRGATDASTGPRSGERGEGSGNTLDSPATYASTGPRSGERGEGLDSSETRSRAARFNGAALGRARRGPNRNGSKRAVASLQRGRARESAERRNRSGRSLPRSNASTGPRSGERGEGCVVGRVPWG